MSQYNNNNKYGLYFNENGLILAEKFDYMTTYRKDGPIDISRYKEKKWATVVADDFFRTDGPAYTAIAYSNGDQDRVWYRLDGKEVHPEAWAEMNGIDLLDMSEIEIMRLNTEVLQ